MKKDVKAGDVRIEVSAAPDSNWSEGTAHIPGGRQFKFSAKSYERPSESGIGGGRISKLTLMTEARRSIVAEYDRGWVRRPRTSPQKAACAALVAFWR